MGTFLSGPSAFLANGDSIDVAAEPGNWPVTHTPAAATQATGTKAAASNTRHICKVISVSIACGATAQTPIQVVLRDGASGAGTILWSKKLSAPANSTATVDLTGLSIVGSINTAMCLEFTGAGVAASEQTINLYGFDVTGQ